MTIPLSRRTKKFPLRPGGNRASTFTTSTSRQLHPSISTMKLFNNLASLASVALLVAANSVLAEEQSRSLRSEQDSRETQRAPFLGALTQFFVCAGFFSGLNPACDDCERLNQRGACNNQENCFFFQGNPDLLGAICFDYEPSVGVGTCNGIGREECQDTPECVVTASLFGGATCEINDL